MQPVLVVLSMNLLKTAIFIREKIIWLIILEWCIIARINETIMSYKLYALLFGSNYWYTFSITRCASFKERYNLQGPSCAQNITNKTFIIHKYNGLCKSLVVSYIPDKSDETFLSLKETYIHRF